jgi:hypothetical protein
MVLLLWFWFFRPPHRSNPIPGTRGAFCRGVFIFEPEFFNTRSDFLQGRRGGLVFFSAQG